MIYSGAALESHVLKNVLLGLSAQNHSSQHNHLRMQWFVDSLWNVFSFSTESVNSNCHLEHACIAANVNKTLKRVSRHFRLKYILLWHFDLSESYQSPIWKHQQLNPMQNWSSLHTTTQVLFTMHIGLIWNIPKHCGRV